MRNRKWHFLEIRSVACVKLDVAAAASSGATKSKKASCSNSTIRLTFRAASVTQSYRAHTGRLIVYLFTTKIPGVVHEVSSQSREIPRFLRNFEVLFIFNVQWIFVPCGLMQFSPPPPTPPPLLLVRLFRTDPSSKSWMPAPQNFANLKRSLARRKLLNFNPRAFAGPGSHGKMLIALWRDCWRARPVH